MMPLAHAEAHERLADLALDPGALDGLGSPMTDPLAAHVATCLSCSAEVRSWRATQASLESARGVGMDRVELGDLAGEEPIPAPSLLRGSVLQAAREDRGDRAGGLASPPPSRLLPPAPRSFATPRSPARPAPRRLLALVAVLGIVAVGTSLLVGQAGRLDEARRQTLALQAVAATLDRVLQDPGHRVVNLLGADGVARGTISWSSRDLVVLTTALEPPPPDRIYRCWVERAGTRSPVGQMWFAGDTAFWTGSLDEWATISFTDGETFGVSLEPAAGSVGNPAILAADFGD